MFEEFNGDYEVTWAAVPMPDGMFEFPTARIRMENGQINGKDDGGLIWTGSLENNPDEQENVVNATVTIDPRTGQPGAVVFHPDGTMRREPVTHQLPLQITKVGNSLTLRTGFNVGPIAITAVIHRI